MLNVLQIYLPCYLTALNNNIQSYLGYEMLLQKRLMGKTSSPLHTREPKRKPQRNLKRAGVEQVEKTL
jgi:hypothetical protein